MPTLRTLQPGDEAWLEEFLLQHSDTSMFLRSNWRTAGLLDQGARFQGTYIAAYIDETIVAVAAHFWNGMLEAQHLTPLLSIYNFPFSGFAGIYFVVFTELIVILEL